MPMPGPPAPPLLTYKVYVDAVTGSGGAPISGAQFTLKNITRSTQVVKTSNETDSNIVIDVADCGTWSDGDEISIAAAKNDVSKTVVTSIDQAAYPSGRYLGTMELLHGCPNDPVCATILGRLNSRFTTPYYTESGGNIDKLMQVVAAPITEMSGVADDITSAHHLSTATGYSLDQWGSLLRVARNTSETDDHYRARLITQSLIYRRSGTAQDMVSSCAGVLGVNTDRISLVDGATPAAFSMTAYISDIVGAGLILSEYSSMMEAAKAAGVSLSLSGNGSFECKGITGSHDSTKGYNDIANNNPDGGTYSGLIEVV